MYRAKVGSPTTVITGNLTASTNTIPVRDVDALTAAPGLATLLDGQGNQEIILYTGISGNDLTGVTRGFEGDAQSWPTGTFISRRLTAYDVNSLQTNLGVIKLNFPDSAGAHNSIYRGKYLGTSFTAAQQAAVAAGTFEDLYIGDYWTIGGINYRIAAFNYFRNVGDTNFTTNHITIVPDTQLYTARMNGTNTTVGGYTGSEMRTTNLSTAITTINNAFPGRVVTHRQLLVNAAASGVASGWAWTNASVELMNEVMVYGTGAWGVSIIGNGYNVASSNGRLPLFSFRQDLVNTRQSYWLRDVVSATSFAIVFSTGYTLATNASTSFGVRPAFSIS